MSPVFRRSLVVAALLAFVHLARAQDVYSISTPSGIDERMYLDIGGVQQHVMIRGEDRSNPVLLLLHGGPGAAASLYAWKYFTRAGWERSFTIVHWDQPGAGKTFARADSKIDPNLTLERVAQDGVLVTQALLRHLGKQKLVLVGASWGTMIGVQMLQARPDLFSAYVAAGQVVNTPEDEAVAYQRVLAKARSSKNPEALAELERGGPPPYSSPAQYRVQRKWAAFYENLPPLNIQLEVSTTPGTVPADLQTWWRGFLASDRHFHGNDMRGPLATADVRAWGRRFATPMFFFQGTEDDVTPSSQVQQYVEWIEAPRKKLVLIKGAGHNALIAKAAVFLGLLDEHVKPQAR